MTNQNQNYLKKEQKMSERNCTESKIINSILSRKDKALLKEIILDWPNLNQVVLRFANKVGDKLISQTTDKSILQVALLNAIEAYEVHEHDKVLSKKYRDFIEELVRGVNEAMLYQVAAFNSDDSEISTLDILKEDFSSWEKEFEDCEIRADKVHDISKFASHKNNINLLILNSICSINDLVNLNVIPDLSQNRISDIWSL